MRQQLPQRRYLVPFGSLTQRLIQLCSLSIILGVLIRLQRQQQQDERILLEKVGNPGFSPACAAVMQLYREGKLVGDKNVLRGKNLIGANWQRAVMPEVELKGSNLSYVDLRDAILERARLEKCDFYRANLAGANLRGSNITSTSFMDANLRGAILSAAHTSNISFLMARAQRAEMYHIYLKQADLQEADLHGAYMQRATLSKALLRDTNLAKANLEGASLDSAKMINANLTDANVTGAYFDKNTILPDAQFLRFGDNGYPIYDKYWTPDTDMARYTNPNHPEFWQPKWVQKQKWVQMNYEEDK
jgi:uncharacterized protein YjbI with pentapeptide repeats